MTSMKVHPFAEKFPMIKGERLDDLVASISKHGLWEPVVRKNGLILDGRNRIAACEKAGVDVKYEEYCGSLSLVDFIGIKNMDRRDLLKDQRVMLAMEWGKALVKEAEKRKLEGQRKGGKTRRKGLKNQQHNLARKTALSCSEGDESDDDIMEDGEMKDTATTTEVGTGKATRDRSLDSRERIAKRAGADVTRHSVQQAQKIKKHRSGKRLTQEIISGEKTIKQVVKEIAPPKKRRNMPVAAWNGLEMTDVILKDIRGNIKSKKPTKNQQKEFFDKELLEGLEVLKKELKL